MKKILILILVLFTFGAKAQDIIYFTFSGGFVNVTLNQNKQIFNGLWRSNTISAQWGKDSTQIYFQLTNSVANVRVGPFIYQTIYINGVVPTSFQNMLVIFGQLTASTGGGGGGGAVNSIDGNIVSNLGGGNYVVNQVPTDWLSVAGLSFILNKPFIIDSGQVVKYRDSNIRYITPTFFF